MTTEGLVARLVRIGREIMNQKGGESPQGRMVTLDDDFLGRACSLCPGEP